MKGVEPFVNFGARTKAPVDLVSFFSKLGNDYGVGLKDLPGIISSVGQLTKDIKLLNQEMPILPVLTALNELIAKKEDIGVLLQSLREVNGSGDD